MDTSTLIQTDQHKRGEALISEIFEDGELVHYGIPGMKWGVRRSQEELDRLAGRTSSKSKKKKTKKTKKSGSSLGDKISERRENRKKERKEKRKIRREGRIERERIREQGKIELEKAKTQRQIRDIQTGADKKTDTSKPVKDMTDKELQERVNRLNLEKQYRTLTKKPRSTTDVVKDFAVKQTGKLATQAADAMIKKAVSSLVGDSSTKAGQKVIEEAVGTVKMPKSVSKNASKAASTVPVSKSTRNVINKLSKNVVPKSKPKSRTLDKLIDVNQMKTMSDIRRAYSYKGRRRLNKDRKVTNRRR